MIWIALYFVFNIGAASVIYADLKHLNEFTWQKKAFMIALVVASHFFIVLYEIIIGDY